MNQEHAALSRFRLVAARETLEEARLLPQAARWRGALNRVYYAMFYAAQALLATKQLASSRHSGVIALFHREFVRSELFAKPYARYLDIAFNLRNRSDYQDFLPPDAERVEELLTAAEFFLVEAERLVRQLLTESDRV
jgi:uncharacterized protein (UPF0332 family)